MEERAISKGSPPTLKSIATRAGVSPATVSLVINNVPNARVSAETKARVRALVSEVGYRPNAMAQSLRTARTRTIGFVTDQIASRPFGGDTIKGAQESAWNNEHILLLASTEGDPEVENAAVEMLLSRRVDGIIYAAERAREAFPPAGLGDVPAVLVDCYVADRSIPSVMPDDLAGGRAATDALTEAGHRRIAFLGAPPLVEAARDRHAGYRAGLEATGIAFEHELVRDAQWSAEGGYRETQALMARRAAPTAIFCVNDTVAMGCYDALKELGFAIGRDVSVIGYDNQHIASLLRPGLSTMALPHYEMGDWAVRYLLSSGRAAQERAQIKLPCPLVERESIRKRPGA